MAVPLIARPPILQLEKPTPYPAPGTMLVVPYNAHKGWPRNGSNVLVCKDGDDGDVPIMKAYDALPTFATSGHSGAGRIIMAEGQINVRMDKIIFDKPGVVLEGQGAFSTSLSSSDNGTSLIRLTNSGGAGAEGLVGALRGFSGWGSGQTGTGIWFNPTDVDGDMGYDGYIIDQVHMGEFSVDALKIGNGTNVGFNRLSVRDSMFQGSHAGINIVPGGGATGVTYVLGFHDVWSYGSGAAGIGFLADATAGGAITEIVWYGGHLDGAVWAIYMIKASRCVFEGALTEGAATRCIYLDADSHDNRFVNFRIGGPTTGTPGSSVYIAGDRNIFDNTRFAPGTSGVNSPIFEIVAGATRNKLLNIPYETGSPTFVSDLGTETKIKWCSDYVTENSGASTGTGSQQTIAHGLSVTPTRQQIALTPGSATALPFHSAAPDATNIYVTAANLQAWYWTTVGP